MRHVTIYGDDIEGLSLGFRLRMLLKGVSKKELLFRYWKQWEENQRKLIEALVESRIATDSLLRDIVLQKPEDTEP